MSFTWETTMGGQSAVKWLKEARELGFSLKAYFLWVESVDATIRRIQARVAEDVLRRRFLKTIQNFFQNYRRLMTSWKLIRNEGSPPRLIAVGKRVRLAIRDKARFERIRAAVQFDL
ncbi:MAG TPA: hypothetical protein VHH88_10785 [Verrucomicrobiae bacterium]|nr:hypothetical protein [Verrucomicrobiae bacterium]